MHFDKVYVTCLNETQQTVYVSFAKKNYKKNNNRELDRFNLDCE